MTTIDKNGEGPDKDKLEELARAAEADPTGEGKEAPPAQEAPAQAPVPLPGKVTPIEQGKRGRGRPRGSKTTKAAPAATPPPEKPPILPPETVKAIIVAPYRIAANLYGEHWALTDDEADRMIPAHLALAEQYLPGVLKENAALYTVCFLHLLTVFGKVQIHYRLIEEEKKKAAEALTLESEAATVTEITDAPPRSTKDVYRSRVRPGPKENPPGV